MFASSIGVLHRGEFLVGAVFVPWPGKHQGIVVHASKNHGAKIDGIRFKMPEKETHKPSGVMTLPGSFSTFLNLKVVLLENRVSCGWLGV
ncbi:MAG: hypothetical protein CM1200mP3_17150 [Chloroflexota bacterium]|nr:MAG: hypothetical protein CM1200mP3_17150 [Chloroflexota bacterium]